MVMKLVFFWSWFFVSVLAVTPFSKAEDGHGIPSDMEIEAAIVELASKSTRLAALEKLIPFVGYGTDSPRPPDRAIIRKAAAAVIRYRDFDTIAMALDSPSNAVQRWAVNCVPQYPDDPDELPGDWHRLLPQVRRLAESGDTTARRIAQDRLRHWGGQREFFARLVETETSAGLVMGLLYELDRTTYLEAINPHLVRILNHKQEEIRSDALLFIGSAEYSAPMRRMSLNDEVLERVLELSRSKSVKERVSATYALRFWKAGDLPLVRSRLFELARDPADEVRWNVPFALRGQLTRDDVQAVLAQLVEDESPSVCYFAILVIGPEKHEQKLHALAAEADEPVASFAAGQLRKLASGKDPR